MADMRISGLASGMNIDEIVTNLMKAERMPLDKIQQKKIYTEWQRDDYRTMNTALSELDKLLAPDGGGVGAQASFIKKTVMVSNENAVSIKNVNSTSDFSGTVNKVTNLAKAATMISTTATTIDDSTKKMSELGISAQKITIKAIDKDGKLVSKDIEILLEDTLDSVISKINADSGVTVFFDKDKKQFSIAAKNTGNIKTVDPANPEAAEIILSSTINTADGFFTKLKMSANNVAASNTNTQVNIGTAESPIYEDVNIGTATDPIYVKAGAVGQNAELTYNGLSIERASNTFTINGAEITLKQVTTDPVTFSSKPDVDTIYDTIKKFVDSYNGLIATISEKTSERKSRDYAPLTDTQKEAMSDDEVEKWEKLAKKGTLSRDSTLSSLLTKMRTSIYTSVGDPAFGSMDKIGISTTKNYLEGGKLEIDETKLREAIKKDPNGIYNLFMADVKKTVDGNQVTDLEKSGIARRLRADLGAAMKDIGAKAGKTSSVNNTFTLGKLLNDYEDKISAFEEKMEALEDRYYRQFGAMEKAINQANSQSASLASFFTPS
jgi:flagellar hook-associated protein 2